MNKFLSQPPSSIIQSTCCIIYLLTYQRTLFARLHWMKMLQMQNFSEGEREVACARVSVCMRACECVVCVCVCVSHNSHRTIFPLVGMRTTSVAPKCLSRLSFSWRVSHLGNPLSSSRSGSVFIVTVPRVSRILSLFSAFSEIRLPREMGMVQRA